LPSRFRSKLAFSSIPDESAKLGELLEQYEATLFEAIHFRKGFDFELFNRELNAWRDDLMTRIIESAVEDTYGNQVKAAEVLGITPRALRYHLQKGRKNSQQGN
jgi:DNA-binding NtrC family response regulator